VHSVFMGIAVLGFGLIIGGLLLDDIFEFGPDWLSVPVVGSALAAFGIFGWVTGSAGTAAGIVVAVSLAGAVGFAALAAVITLRLRDGHTDATPRAEDLIGIEGRVVTPIDGGLGEILAVVAGSQRKLTAHCEQSVDFGGRVVIVSVLSDSSVRVVEHDRFWEQVDQPRGRS